jgi:ATPase subunit of ABC transporter with duplicated ATPase domains
LALSLILKRVTKRYADNLIFENVFLELHAGDRVGLLGRNGSGKTTLMKLLTKLEQPDAGEVSCSGHLAYLEQRSELEAGSLREIVLPVRHRQLKTALEVAQQNLEHPSNENLERFALAEEAFRVTGGYDIEARAENILAGLGLSGDRSSQALSGGQERRALLARLLIEPSDFYLLDEPTNHHDLESLMWLEGFVNSSEAGFLIVSHDRAFLDATVTSCYELERGKLTEYPGNYSEAMEVKRVLREAALVAFENHTRKVKQLELEAQLAAQQASRSYNKNRMGNRDATSSWHKGNRAQHSTGRRTLALEKRIEHMGELEKPFEENFMTRIKLGNLNHGPNEVLTLENLKLERGEKLILEGLNLHVRRGERLALVGVNGGGKSTLLKAILGQLPISSGKILTGVGLNMYWAGQNTEELDEHETLKDALLAANPDLETRELFALLASLGLPKDPTRAITTLSGGQRTRLSLARLSVTKAHLLILDEPTNNLDIDAIQALEKLLLEFPGTIIFASHDRRLLENVSSKTLEIPSLKLKVRD